MTKLQLPISAVSQEHRPFWQTSASFILLYCGMAAMYAFVALTSFGYDDEIFNIRLIETYGFGAVQQVQTLDVHPPGSYLINWLLFSLLGDWSWLRLVSALMTVAAIVYFSERTRRDFGPTAALISIGLMGFNPALLMWSTSIRWLAYFTPLLIFLLLPPRRSDGGYWAKLFCGLLLLAYLGYAGLILAPALIWLYWCQSDQTRREKLSWIVKFSLLFVLLYAYQAGVLVSVHMKHSSRQVFGLLRSLEIGVYTQFINQGVFPVTIPGLASLLSGLALLFLLWRHKLTALKSATLQTYLLSLFLLIASGVAGKLRNMLFSVLFQTLWLREIRPSPQVAKLWYGLLSVMVLTNLAGDLNVARHEGVTKNVWNIPVNQVLNLLEAERSDCHGDLAILSHDPVLIWHLQKRHFEIFGQAPSIDRLNAQSKTNRECMAILYTFRGSIPSARYQVMMAEVEALGYTARRSIALGKDSHSRIKRMIDPEFPDSAVEILILRNVTGIDGLADWLPRPARPLEKR